MDRGWSQNRLVLVIISLEGKAGLFLYSAGSLVFTGLRFRALAFSVRGKSIYHLIIPI